MTDSKFRSPFLLIQWIFAVVFPHSTAVMLTWSLLKPRLSEPVNYVWMYSTFIVYIRMYVNKRDPEQVYTGPHVYNNWKIMETNRTCQIHSNNK